MADKMCYAWDAMPGRPATKPTPVFGSRLSALRQERGWTQVELAERLGVTVKMVTYYEREAANPTAKTVAKLAAAFGVEPTAFIEGPAPRRVAKPGPPSEWDKRVATIKQLPRGRQREIQNVVDALIAKAG
jgi:transcriptional regulator with XRE-family HTH domain